MKKVNVLSMITSINLDKKGMTIMLFLVSVLSLGLILPLESDTMANATADQKASTENFPASIGNFPASISQCNKIAPYEYDLTSLNQSDIIALGPVNETSKQTGLLTHPDYSFDSPQGDPDKGWGWGDAFTNPPGDFTTPKAEQLTVVPNPVNFSSMALGARPLNYPVLGYDRAYVINNEEETVFKNGQSILYEWATCWPQDYTFDSHNQAFMRWTPEPFDTKPILSFNIRDQTIYLELVDKQGAVHKIAEYQNVKKGLWYDFDIVIYWTHQSNGYVNGDIHGKPFGPVVYNTLADDKHDAQMRLGLERDKSIVSNQPIYHDFVKVTYLGFFM